jgi:hypothetical protein
MAKQLEIEQDPPFQRRMWKFQKYGMIFLLLFFLAAFTGLLGSGPLSYKEYSGGEFISIEYPYFVRFSHPEDLKISIQKTDEDTVHLIVNRDYLEKINVERIMPEPVEQSVYKNFIQFSFLSSETGDLNIVFNLQFRQSGIIKGELGIKDKSLTTITHLVYP